MWPIVSAFNLIQIPAIIEFWTETTFSLIVALSVDYFIDLSNQLFGHQNGENVHQRFSRFQYNVLKFSQIYPVYSHRGVKKQGKYSH